MKSWADIVKTAKPMPKRLVSEPVQTQLPVESHPTDDNEIAYMMKVNPFLWNDMTECYRKKVNNLTLKIKNLETRIETHVLDKTEEKSIMTQIKELPLEKKKLLPFCVIAPETVSEPSLLIVNVIDALIVTEVAD